MSYTSGVRGGHALLFASLAAGCGGGSAQPDAPVDVVTARCDPTAPFKPGVALASLDTAQDDVSARLTADELAIVFARRNTDNTYDLYMSTRAQIADPFPAAQILGSVNSIYSDLWPTISADAMTLYFQSDRITPGTFHVWLSHRISTTSLFPTPIMESGLQNGDQWPYLTAAGDAVYFGSSMRMGAGANDIFRAARDATGTLAMPMTVLGGVNTTADEVTPALTGDELRIFFCHQTTDCDIYTASRSSTTDGFGAAAPVDGLAVAGTNEVPTWVSPDGCHLYYYANPTGSAGQDLYVATRE